MRFIVFLAAATMAMAGEYTTYVGDQYLRTVAAITADAAGNTYVVGNRGILPTNSIPSSQQLPVMISSILVKPPLPFPNDVFVSKLDPTGKVLFTDVFAGKGADLGLAVAVDSSGNIYVAGSTDSPDFPVSNALQSEPGQNGAGFIVKLSPDGKTILYSTYFGGAQGSTTINALTTDAAGNLYLTGTTYASDFPHTAGMPVATAIAFQADGGPPYPTAAFVTEISSAGDKILFSGTIGGDSEPCLAGRGCNTFTAGVSVSLDAAGNVYFGGNTDTVDLPTTSGVLSQRGIGAFVGKIAVGGRGLAYLTYLGEGSELAAIDVYGTNVLNAMAVDAAGNAYLAGATADPKFPATPGSFQSTFAGKPIMGPMLAPNFNGFLAKLKPDGSAMVWATYLGGPGDDYAASIAVDSAGNVWSSGGTTSANFPNSQGWSQGGDFLVEMNRSGTALLYSARYPNGTVTRVALDKTALLYTAGVSGIVSEIATGPPLMRVFGIQNVVGGTLAGRIARAEVISIYGPHIGPATPIPATPANGFYPTTLGGVQVTIGGIAAPLLYVSDGQINAVAPMELTAQSASTIQIQNGTSSTSPAFPLWIDSSSVNIFPGVLNKNGSLNAVTNPAKAGSAVSFYATGWQPDFRPLLDGEVATQANDYCACYTSAGETVLYGGAAPGIVAGVTQFNIQLNSAMSPGVTSVAIDLYGASTLVWITP